MLKKLLKKTNREIDPVEKFIIELIQDSTWSHKLKLSSTFKELKMDDLDYIEMIMEVEKEYGISIGDEELPTIRDLVKLTKKYIKG